MYHFDVRLKCLESGKLEATVSSYMTNRAAERVADQLNERSSYPKYVVVGCTMPGNHRVHDVDISYFEHMRDCRGYKDMLFERMVGEPTHFEHVSDFPFSGEWTDGVNTIHQW